MDLVAKKLSLFTGFDGSGLSDLSKLAQEMELRMRKIYLLYVKGGMAAGRIPY